MAVGQRPDRAVPRAGDAVAGVLRPRRQPPAQRRRARRAGIKYFVLGGFSSAFFLYGIALVYGAVGTTNISRDRRRAVDGTVPLERNDALVLAGVALLLVGLGFKVAAVPFHVWTPDVYQGAPTPVTGVHGVGRQGRRVRRAAARASSSACRSTATTGGRRSGCSPCCRSSSARSSPSCRPTSSGCSPTRRSATPGSSSSGSRPPAHRAGEADAGLGVPSVARLPARLRGARRRHVRRRRPRRPPRRRRTPTSTRSAGSAGAARCSRSGSRCSSSPRPACRSRRGFIAKFGVIQRRASTSTATRSAIIAMVVVGRSPRSSTCGSWSAPGWPTPPDDEAASRLPIPFSAGLAIAARRRRSRSLVGIFPGWLLDAAETTTEFARYGAVGYGAGHGCQPGEVRPVHHVQAGRHAGRPRRSGAPRSGRAASGSGPARAPARPSGSRHTVTGARAAIRQPRQAEGRVDRRRRRRPRSSAAARSSTRSQRLIRDKYGFHDQGDEVPRPGGRVRRAARRTPYGDRVVLVTVGGSTAG